MVGMLHHVNVKQVVSDPAEREFKRKFVFLVVDENMLFVVFNLFDFVYSDLMLFGSVLHHKLPADDLDGSFLISCKFI
jgi:hypothetical protein